MKTAGEKPCKPSHILEEIRRVVLTAKTYIEVEGVANKKTE